MLNEYGQQVEVIDGITYNVSTGYVYLDNEEFYTGVNPSVEGLLQFHKTVEMITKIFMVATNTVIGVGGGLEQNYSNESSDGMRTARCSSRWVKPYNIYEKVAVRITYPAVTFKYGGLTVTHHWIDNQDIEALSKKGTIKEIVIDEDFNPPPPTETGFMPRNQDEVLAEMRGWVLNGGIEATREWRRERELQREEARANALAALEQFPNARLSYDGTSILHDSRNLTPSEYIEEMSQQRKPKLKTKKELV